jgi:hypothetical protein
MSMRAKFARWVLLFAGIGLLIPAVAETRYLVFAHGFGELEAKLWPSSLMFFALEAPDTRAIHIVIVWVVAVVANVILYALFGVLTWPLVYIASHIRASR